VKHGISLALLALVATHTAINATAAEGPSQIPSATITAPRAPTPEELAGESVPHFVESHSTRNILTGHLARWRSGVCPLVQGLDPGFNDFVASRIRAVAAAVGAPVGREGKCKSNVLVAFTLQPQALLDEIAKHYPYLLGFHYPHQTRQLATVTRAIQGWYFTATIGCHGEQTADVGLYDAGSRAGGCLGSRLTERVMNVFTVVFIVADLNKVVDQEIGTISDYLAVLSLTQAQPPVSCGTLPSILDFMAGDCPRSQKAATSITAGDLAYLKGLYQTNLEQPIELERSNIANHMLRQLASAGTP
jgi:hypothetical protein